LLTVLEGLALAKVRRATRGLALPDKVPADGLLWDDSSGSVSNSSVRAYIVVQCPIRESVVTSLECCNRGALRRHPRPAVLWLVLRRAAGRDARRLGQRVD
jgi:hypothetical protein